MSTYEVVFWTLAGICVALIALWLFCVWAILTYGRNLSASGPDEQEDA